MSVVPDDSIQEYRESKAPLSSDGSASPDMPPRTSHADLINEALYPSDSYTADGTYWADLPAAQRWKFATTQFNQESRREVKYVWDMFKADPMQPFRAYWRKYVLTGMGLFVEGAFRRPPCGLTFPSSTRRSSSLVRWLTGSLAHAGYVLFSIGNLSALFSSAWPRCWKTFAVCDESAFFRSLISASSH